MVDSISNALYPDFLKGDMSAVNGLQDEASKRLIDEFKNADRSFESVDVAKNPSKYTAEQKIIMLLDLLQSKANYGGYQEALREHYSWIGANAEHTSHGVLRTNDEIKADFERAISSLQGDKAVQTELNQRLFKEIRGMFADGQHADAYTAFKQHFEDNVVSGKMLTDGLAAGLPLKDVVNNYSAATYFYSQILSDADFKAKSVEAQKNYSDFLQSNILDNVSPTTAINRLVRSTAADLIAQDRIPGLGSVSPTVADSQLATTVFGDGLYDHNLMQGLSDKMELFAPTVNLLANQMFGNNKTAADAFTAEVMRILPVLWNRVADGQMSEGDFQGNLERLLTGTSSPTGVDGNDFKTSIEEAVIALIHGGALVAQAQPTNIEQPLTIQDATGKFVRQSGLDTYTNNEISAMIAAATGLAGRSRADMNVRGSGSRDDSNPAHTARLDQKLFGIENHAWDGALTDAFDFNSVQTAAAKVTELVTDRAPDLAVTDPIPVKGIYGFDGVLPTVADSGLSTTVFGDSLYNGGLMQSLSGKMKLFEPTVKLLANQLFGDNQPAADAFSAKVMEILPTLWSKMANGEMSAADFEGNLDRLLSGAKIPTGVSGSDFTAAVKDAVVALIQGGAVVSQIQPSTLDQPLVVLDANGKSVRQSGLNSYSDNEISAMIAAATGLAGRSITNTRTSFPEGRGDATDESIATVDSKMFGIPDHGWDNSMLNAFSFKDVETAATKLTDYVANHAGDLKVMAPKAVKSLSANSSAKNIAAIFGPTLSVLASQLFANNLPAQQQFQINVMSIVTSVWGIGKPGGDLETTLKLLREKMEVEITPPPGVAKNKYIDALMDGANALVNGAVVAYRSATGRNATPDAIAATVLYGTSVASRILSGTGHFLSSIDDIGKMFGNAASWRAQASTMFAADTLKMAATTIGAAVGAAWIGVDLYWTITAGMQGADGLELSLYSIATIADSIVGIGGVVSAASKGLQFAIPELSGALSFSSTFSTVLGVASLVSNLAWLGIVAYQDIKEDREFDKLTNRMSDQTKRLLDDPILFNGPRPIRNPPDWSPW
jgi:hypothetical protein